MKTKLFRSRAWSTLLMLSGLFITASAHAATVQLFAETFDGITTGYSGGDPQQFGIPTSGGGTTINGGADKDWYGARFEPPNNGTIAQDVGVQKIGGGPNGTPVGLVEDDAGLMFKIDTTGYENITLEFDWRTFSAYGTDRFVVGYFVGDLTAGHPDGFASNRTIDLRNADHGGTNGAWNWNPINGGGNTGDWTELLRDRNNTWSTGVSFDLTLADNAPEVWIAFWLDNGENDFGKFDNVSVTATVVPVPPAVWLFGSGLIGLVGIARRKKTS